MRQHTAKKQSVFHTELHASWSRKVLKIDMPRVPRQWEGLSWLPFARSGWLMEAKRQPSVPQTVDFLSRVSIFWADMAYARTSTLWKSQLDFFAER
jgi:hypothetical protein